jgi:hypothetical protein
MGLDFGPELTMIDAALKKAGIDTLRCELAGRFEKRPNRLSSGSGWVFSATDWF